MKISIFPLNLVIFPQSRYPLHIFEERYKKLVQRCIQKSEGFGITASYGNSLAEIGSLVFIEHVAKKYKDGKLDIVVKCKNRIKIDISKISTHTDGYLESDAMEYSDSEFISGTDTLSDVLKKFQDILKMTDIELEDSYWKKLEEIDLFLKSFKIAEKSGLTLEQQQTLLQKKSEAGRLKYLSEHFDKVKDYLSETAAVKGIVMGDGYLN